MQKKIKVLALYGGQSVEHEISVITAMQACEAFDKSKFEVLKCYISKDGKMYFGVEVDSIENYRDLNFVTGNAMEVKIALDKAQPVLVNDKNKEVAKFDIAFPIVHGTNVEDGTVHGFLDFYQIPYIGSNLESAAVGQDKIYMKLILKSSGVPVVDYDWFYANQYLTDPKAMVLRLEKNLGYPMIIKPAKLGSSIGINVAKNAAELIAALDEAIIYDDRILVEVALSNFDEFNCSVLGDFENHEASVVEQVMKTEEILSYADKYEKGGKKGKQASAGMASVDRVIPANISSTLNSAIQDLANETFLVLGNSGVVRIDFLYDPSKKQLYVNEINTIPGSLAFYLWEDKYPYSLLLEKLVKIGIDKKRRRENKVFSFDTNVLANFGKDSFNGNKGGK